MQRPAEIIWYGRAGQGILTSSYILAELMAYDGTYVQAFPEFNAEKRGSAMIACNRFSTHKIRIHSKIQNADVVIVIDYSTLPRYTEVKKRAKSDTVFFFNSVENLETIKEKLGLVDKRVFTLDGMRISVKELGISIPSFPLLTAVVNRLDLVPMDIYKERMRDILSRLYNSETVNANLRTVDSAVKMVIGP